MKKLLLLVLLFISTFLVRGQRLVATSGDYFENSSGSVSLTLGELAIETYITDAEMLTQGMQQTKLVITAIHEVEQFVIKAYPNPTSDLITISLDDYQGAMYELIGLQGNVLEKKQFTSNNHELSLGALPSGTYLLRITSKKRYGIYKIIKR